MNKEESKQQNIHEDVIDVAWAKFNKLEREILFNEPDHAFMKFLLKSYDEYLNTRPTIQVSDLKVRNCHNTSTIFDTRDYYLKSDVQQLLQSNQGWVSEFNRLSEKVVFP